MHIDLGKLILITTISLISLSCASAEIKNSDKESGETVIGNVPFVKQKYRFCGPAALTSVMRYHGADIDQDEIAENVYTPELKGSLISDMRYYAGQSGYSARTENGSIDEIIQLIDKDRPVIVLVDKGKLGLKVQHYYVVYGYDPRNSSFTIHDGEKSGRKISYSKLDSQWEKMNRYMLVIENEN